MRRLHAVGGDHGVRLRVGALLSVCSEGRTLEIQKISARSSSAARGARAWRPPGEAEGRVEPGDRLSLGHVAASVSAILRWTSFFTSSAGSGWSMGKRTVPFDVSYPRSSSASASITAGLMTYSAQ